MNSVGPASKFSNMNIILEIPELAMGVRSEDSLVDSSLTLQRMLIKDQEINTTFCSKIACLWRAHLTFLG